MDSYVRGVRDQRSLISLISSGVELVYIICVCVWGGGLAKGIQKVEEHVTGAACIVCTSCG